jgi:site-specific recombinase XerD
MTTVPQQGSDAIVGHGPTGRSVQPHRKLHLGHIAFMRAVVQGLDPKQSWERYLRSEGELASQRQLRKTIQWIRDEFAAAARQNARHGLARLVQIDPTMVSDKTSAPDVATFVLSHDLEGFSEDEQLALYREHYPNPSRRQGRRARLVAHQLQALTWFEQRTVLPPLADDPLSWWLAPNLAARLATAGITTPRALAERINGRGERWWTGIAGIGIGKAQRVLAWLCAHEKTTGLALVEHATMRLNEVTLAQRSRIAGLETGVVPLDKLVVPAHLDGSDGLYRAPKHLCLIKAPNDYEAILIWLRSRTGLPQDQMRTVQQRRGISRESADGELDWLQCLSHTQRAYLREAERFMLWAIIERGKPLSSMTPDDCDAYRRFLQNPAPAARWCGPRARQRWSPEWRPFEGRLSASAQSHAITILKSFYTFLVNQCYLIQNPWDGLKLATGRKPLGSGRSFTQEQWAFIEQRLSRLPDTPVNHRLRFALLLFYETGLRLSEAVLVTVDDLGQTLCEDPSGAVVRGWTLSIKGAGNKERILPLSNALVARLSVYLTLRGLHADPLHSSHAGVCLLARTDSGRRGRKAAPAQHEAIQKTGLSASVLARQLKAFFTECAQSMAADPQAASQFARASTHWLRHTNAAQSIASGIPIDIVQQNLGHASRATTANYAKA